MPLFHLSEKDLDGQVLEPRVPKNFMTRKGYEDNETPRVSFAESVDGALMGIGGNIQDKEFYVHELANEIKTQKPTQEQVPDAHLSKEVWGLEPAELKNIKKIKTLNAIDTPHNYEYGDGKNADLYQWNWKEANVEQHNHIMNNHWKEASMEEQEQPDPKPLLAGGATLGGMLGAQRLADNLKRSTKEDPNKFSELVDRANKMGYSVEKGDPSFVDTAKNKIQAKDYSALGHELGHATENYPLSEGAKNIVFGDAFNVGNKVAPPAAALGIGGHMALKDKNPKAAKALAGAGLGLSALTLPRVFEEGRASFKGVKDFGADPKGLAKSFAGYGATALPFLATAGYLGYDKMKGRDRDGNESDRQEDRHIR